MKPLIRWWFAALSDGRGWLAAIRLASTALALGLILGWGGTRAFGIYILEETRLPKPVIDPPVGQRWVPVKTTGYCPCTICCGAFSDGRTAINRDVTKFPYGIAVEPKLVPYRLMVDVPGYGVAMVDDTGGAMRRSATKGVIHFDLRFTTHTQARQWGVRHLWVALPDNIPATAASPPPP
jgi:3D (Asp-Asp-Asp) domain-containing protein